MKKQNPCHICMNAKVCPDLDDQHDLSYYGVGVCDQNFRILIKSGNRRPTEILFEEHRGSEWKTIGFYEPKYCPNCGREITEYKGRDINE